jgi:gamma-glutamyltranspeptidase/glutathione hydrolase
MRNFQLPGRSPVLATNGMVSTSHPLATSTALNVLRDGGNAVDAAIAASAVLCVVEPAMTGIGGDCFAIVCEPDGSVHGLNGSGRAASGAHLDWYLERGITDLNDHPAHSVTVPGALKAWDALLTRFGTKGFQELFSPAIAFGRDGFPVASRVARDWAWLGEKIHKHPGAKAHISVNGRAPAFGEIFKFPALAQTLETVAREGVGALYSGTIAAEIAATVQAEGGFLSEEDLAGVSADWVTPISTNYGGIDVHEIPPNGQGITALILLNLLDRLGARKHDANSVERAHLEMEAGRIAYSLRDAYVADPENMSARVEQLLSDQYSDELAKQFNPRARNDEISMPKLPDSDTTYLTVVDRDLRAVSFINSLYNGFGSGIVTPNSGIALQNRGACFSLEAGHDNSIGPSKRPMHTIIPGMATKNGKLAWSFGVMGGSYQPMGHAHVLTNMIDYGMDPQEALDHGRMFWADDGVLDIEDGVSAEVSKGLASLGHRVRAAAMPHGGGQIIGIDHKNGVMIAGSEPRKDGMAAGY